MNYHESEFATGKQDACFRVIKVLTQVPGRMLPEASSTEKLYDDLMFFSEKNQLIREKITIQLATMDTTITDIVVNGSIVHKLAQFTPTTEKELERIIRSCPAKKQCGPFSHRRAQENATLSALIPGNFSQQ